MLKHQQVKPVFIESSEVELRQDEESVLSPQVQKRETNAFESEEALPKQRPYYDQRGVSVDSKLDKEWVNLKKTNYRYLVLLLACLFQFFAYVSEVHTLFTFDIYVIVVSDQTPAPVQS